MTRAVTVLALSAMLTGCLPGPRPAPPLAAVAPPVSWRDTADGVGEIDPHWWTAYGDPALDRLVDAALTRNTDVLSASAAVDASRAQVRLARSALLPAVGASGDVVQSHAMGLDAQTVTGLVTASWEVDLFGRLRALTEAARRQYVASQADRDATALAVTVQTVRTYIELLAIDAQVQLTRETLQSYGRSLRLVEDQSELGYSSQLEFLQARGEVEAVAAQLPAQLLSQRTQENALAILTGDFPRAVERARRLSALRVPAVPATLPSQLVRRRPDVASAEYLLAAADSTIAAQRAVFLPSLTLSGDYGQVLPSVANFNPATIWSIGESVLAPLFQGGRLTAGLDLAAARRDQAAFAYRATVLNAFGEVENGLTAVARLREQVAALTRRVATAQSSLAIADDRFRFGYSGYLSLLDAQRSLYGAQQTLIVTQSDQLTNIAALDAALGGGWNRAGLTRSIRADAADLSQDRTPAATSAAMPRPDR